MNSIIPTLVGTWFICFTNFPMWLKGNKTNPTFNYSIIKGKENQLLDEVKFLKKGKEKSIRGIDYQDNQVPSTFVWRGQGMLRVLKSKWQVKLLDKDGQWAVIWFSKTLFTPEGVDVICRPPRLDADTFNHIKNQMLQDSVLKKHVHTLIQL
ncbi:hypothetical protein P1X15_16245 [Runella sp. MFBS21]|uniref:hypothetical protein n=1 Tax=Runella sp. MFBS21 TaxID=3034018 RepID=UPI0023F7358F|nr:hypothetical protein [Runella sp. MFBS21]MDF7819170.1 hypothetical protein [Runella sp. MFBS21]